MGTGRSQEAGRRPLAPRGGPGRHAQDAGLVQVERRAVPLSGGPRRGHGHRAGAGGGAGRGRSWGRAPLWGDGRFRRPRWWRLHHPVHVLGAAELYAYDRFRWWSSCVRCHSLFYYLFILLLLFIINDFNEQKNKISFYGF